MLAFYPQIKAVHIAAVLLSGGLFVVRGALVQLGRARWAMWAPVRYASYGIDTVLLTAALLLVAILPAALFANHWLTAKLTFLVAYVVLGSLALKRAQSATARRACFALAIAAYVMMLGIARTHHPLGWLSAIAQST